MTPPTRITRRELLRGGIAAGALLAGGGLAACATLRPRRRGLRLVFYSDVHARPEFDTPLALARAAEAINARRPDLVFAGGDLITDGFQSSYETVAPRWDVYMAFHRSIRAEVHPALGNHDLVAAIPEDGSAPSPDPRAVFRERFGLERTYRSFDALGTHFVLLDSVEIVGGELKYEGRIGPEQLDWLERDLARVARGTPVVVVLHIPLLTAFYAATEGGTAAAPRNRVVVNNREVLARFAGRRVPLVLQGHLHAKEMVRWQETTFVTGGAISGKWWRGAWFGTNPGFCVVELDGDRVACEYVEYGWEPRRPHGV
jgi:3',5'-cyclic AMP phosphodiesterase CpdA